MSSSPHNSIFTSSGTPTSYNTSGHMQSMQNKQGKGKGHVNLKQFLNAHRVNSGEVGTTTTHTGKGAYLGAYNVPKEQQTELLAHVADAVYARNENVYLVERPGVAGPLRVDLDINYTIDPDQAPEEGVRVYDSNMFLDSFIASLVSALRGCVVMPPEAEKNLLFVFEKSQPTLRNPDKQEYKDGVHIMMPEVITSPEVQEHIRQTVMSDMGDMLEDLCEVGFQITNEPKDIYDEAIIKRNGWMVYGCGKEESPRYELKSIYNTADSSEVHKYTESECDDAPATVRKWLMMLFMQRHCKHSKGDTSSYAVNFMEYLCISGYDEFSECAYTTQYETERQAMQERELKKREKKAREDPGWRYLDASDLEFVVNLIDTCLSDERASDYHAWSKLGWCLHNIHNDNDNNGTSCTVLERYIAFSLRCKKYSEEEVISSCTQLWEEARAPTDTRDKLGMGSLCDWAKMDAPDTYKTLVSSRLDNLIRRCCEAYMPKPIMLPPDEEGGPPKPDKVKTMAFDDVNWYLVEVLHKKYGFNMVCTSVSSGHKSWWEYKNHRWTDITEGLRNYLSIDVHELFMNYAKRLMKQLATKDPKDPGQVEERANIERLRNAALGIARHTRNTTSKSKVFLESCERFSWSYRSHTKDRRHDKQFEQLLDLNLYLIGMENGVYDLKMHAFRPGCSDDMISRCTGNVWYAPADGWEDPQVRAIKTFLAQVLPDRNVRNYVMMLFASFLHGKVSELFHIFVGCGGNGKSKLIDLFTAAMGQSSSGGGYCGNLPTSALTGKRGCSSGPSPEFERLRGMRFVTVQEPETKDRLQSGRLKELTGGDTIQARALHKAPIEFKPQFGIVMASNVLPKVPGDDGGLWRRMRVVRFKSRFRRTPNPDDPTEFPIDENLTDKLHAWRLTFFWMLTRYYKVYTCGDHGEAPVLDYEAGEARLDAGLPLCRCVEMETVQYQSKNDPINKFIRSYVKTDVPPTEQKHANIEFDDLWQVYASWCKTQLMQADQDELVNAMEHRFDVIQETLGFRGWRKIRMYTGEERTEISETKHANA